MEGADGNANMVWPQVSLPEHRRPACRAEMHPDLPSLLPIADIDFGGAFGTNMLLPEKGNNAEHRTGPPLTLATMADAYNIRIGGCLDTQGTATAKRSSRHSTPPYPWAARLQEDGCHSDRLLSIVLLAPKSLSGGFRGTTGRRCGGFAKEVPGNVEKGEAPTFPRVGFRIRFDEISTASSLEWISTRIGTSPKSTSWRRPFFPRIMA
jgi:hypothetical protein